MDDQPHLLPSLNPSGWRRALATLRSGLSALAGHAMLNARRAAPTVRLAFAQGARWGLAAVGMTVLSTLRGGVEAVVSLPLLLAAGLFDLARSPRALTALEQAQARLVFGEMIDLGRVRISSAAWPTVVLTRLNGGRPFTTMFLIHEPRHAPMSTATLIHELTHVWQASRTGPLYMVHALEAQWGAGLRSWWQKGRFDDSLAYAVSPQALDRRPADLLAFNAEAQARIVEHYWVQRFSGQPRAELPSAAQLEACAAQVCRPIKSPDSSSPGAVRV